MHNGNKDRDGIYEYYAEKRRKAAEFREKLAKAKAEGADRDTIDRLERQLELALYTGD